VRSEDLGAGILAAARSTSSAARATASCSARSWTGRGSGSTGVALNLSDAVAAAGDSESIHGVMSSGALSSAPREPNLDVSPALYYRIQTLTDRSGLT